MSAGAPRRSRTATYPIQNRQAEARNTASLIVQLSSDASAQADTWSLTEATARAACWPVRVSRWASTSGAASLAPTSYPGSCQSTAPNRVAARPERRDASRREFGENQGRAEPEERLPFLFRRGSAGARPGGCRGCRPHPGTLRAAYPVRGGSRRTGKPPIGGAFAGRGLSEAIVPVVVPLTGTSACARRGRCSTIAGGAAAATDPRW
jgi:hypothetical protein